MIKTAILNVTTIEPRLKHPTIFEHFDALEGGESFIILNDHDPRPLYYQLLGERGNIFTWEYLESGPEWWRVNIAKTGGQSKQETVGEIAAADMRKAEVFKKLGIDFCCGGKVTLKEAAATAGLTEEALREELDKSESQGAVPVHLDFNSWDISFLADYIKNIHHGYIREFGPIIEQLANKVASRHGNESPELLALAKDTHDFMADLYQHIEKEEAVLFPATKDLSALENEDIDRIIDDLHREHEDAGAELVHFRKLTKDYELPAHACNSYTYLYERMKAFEQDLLQHVHLENNILFPKIIETCQEQLNVE